MQKKPLLQVKNFMKPVADQTIADRSVTKRSALTLLVLSAGYLLLSYVLVGFQYDQLVLTATVNVLYFLSPSSRKLVVGFSVYIVYWVIFDYMKAFPNYWFSTVRIESLYNAEKALFGIRSNGLLLTPNEFFLDYTHGVLDAASGVFYLTWVPLPLVFALFLFFTARRQFVYFSFTFLLVNLLGFTVYYLYPAAPPWYVQLHGFDFVSDTPGNAAGLARFDALLGINVFSSIYAKSSNVFAAMPSLHSSYPILVLFYGVKNRLGAVNIVFAVITAGIWFAAVYTSQHYVLDVLAGIACAVCGILIFNRAMDRKGVFYRAATLFERAVQ